MFLAAGDEPRPTVLLVHGVPGIEQNYDMAHALRAAGWNSVICHFRGCWGSEGSYSIPGMIDDLRALVDDLSGGRHPEVDPARLTVVAHSFGSWAAIMLALTDQRIRGLAAYGSVPDPRWCPDSEADLLAHCLPWVRGIDAREFRRQYDSLGDDVAPILRIHELAPRPLLLVHGGADTGVPLADAQKLYDSAGEPRELAVHPDADHDFSWHRPWLCATIVDWHQRVDPIRNA